MTILCQTGLIFVTATVLVAVGTASALRNEKIQFGVCKQGADDINFFRITLSQCIQNCFLRKDCVSLNFQRRTLFCALHRNNSTLSDCKSTGIVYSAKITWKIQAPTDCSTCLPYQTCSYGNSTAHPQCLYTECRIQQNLSEGKILGNQRHVGSNVLYTCQQGYDLHGKPNRTCLDSGDWSGIEPICCPSGWLQYERSCYKFETGLKLKFDDALAHCQQLHQRSTLLLIESAGEDTYIKDTLERLEGFQSWTTERWQRAIILLQEIQTNPRWDFFWIGIVRIGNVWKSVKTNTTVSWFNWAPSEPNQYKGNSEKCGSVFFSPYWSSWGWNDIRCETYCVTTCELNRN